MGQRKQIPRRQETAGNVSGDDADGRGKDNMGRKKEHHGQTKKKREKEMRTARIWQNKRQLPGIPGDL